MSTRTFKSFTEMAEALGYKRRKPQKDWLEGEMKKISKCPRCGAQLKYSSGTNIMTCLNKVMVEVEKDGKKVKEQRDCGFIKFMNPSTAGYAQFLSDGLQEAQS